MPSFWINSENDLNSNHLLPIMQLNTTIKPHGHGGIIHKHHNRRHVWSPFDSGRLRMAQDRRSGCGKVQGKG